MLSLNSVGFSTSRLHTYSFYDNGCDKCICSLSESSNVISVVSKAQWKSYILMCMKSQKSNVCYQHIGKCLALVFCFMMKSIFIGQQLSQLVPSWTFFCEINSHICSFGLSLPTYCHTTLPPPPQTTVPVLVLARMFTMSSFSFCVKNSELFPLFPVSLSLQEFV